MVGGQEGGGSEQEDFDSCGPNGPGHCVGTKRFKGKNLAVVNT